MHTIPISLGPASVDLEIHSPLQPDINRSPWKNFVKKINNTDKSAVKISIEAGSPSLSEGDTLIFDAGSSWKLYRDKKYENRVFMFHFGEKKPVVSMNLDSSGQNGRILTILHGKNVFPLQYPVDEILFQELLARAGGVIVHAAAFIGSDGRGYLFPGVSGAGKSTLSRAVLRDGSGTLLCDDRIVLWSESGKPMIGGTPWFGDVPVVNQVSVPLSGIFFIQHGFGPPSFSTLTPSSAASLLMSRSVPPFWNRNWINRILGLVDSIATGGITTASFSYTPGPGLLERAIEYVNG